MKALRLVLLVIAMLVVACLGWRLQHPVNGPLLPQLAGRFGFSTKREPPAVVTPVSRPPPAPGPGEARALVLSRLGDAPDYAPFFDRLREAFPSDYTAFMEGAVATLLQTGRVPNPDRLLIDALRRLRQTRGVLAAKAEPGPLASIFDAQATLLDALSAENASLCVEFLYGGISPSFMAFAAKHREPVERLAIANLSAIASGKASQIERIEPSSDDFDSLTDALKKRNVSDNEISAVLDGKTFDPPLPEPRLCDAGRLYLRALAEMPEDVRLRVYALSAALVARS